MQTKNADIQELLGNNEQNQLAQILGAASPSSSLKGSDMSSDQEDQTVQELVDAPSPLSSPKGGDESNEGGTEDKATPTEAELGGSIDTTRFPWKLHRMLSEIEKGDVGLEHIVSWQPQ